MDFSDVLQSKKIADDANELAKRSGRLYCREAIKSFETQVYPRWACDGYRRETPSVLSLMRFEFGFYFKDVRRVTPSGLR